MEEKKTTYEATGNQIYEELIEAADVFSRLSPEMQDAILELLHSIVDKK